MRALLCFLLGVAIGLILVFTLYNIDPGSESQKVTIAGAGYDGPSQVWAGGQ